MPVWKMKSRQQNRLFRLRRRAQWVEGVNRTTSTWIGQKEGVSKRRKVLWAHVLCRLSQLSWSHQQKNWARLDWKRPFQWRETQRLLTCTIIWGGAAMNSCYRKHRVFRIVYLSTRIKWTLRLTLTTNERYSERRWRIWSRSIGICR